MARTGRQQGLEHTMLVWELVVREQGRRITREICPQMYLKNSAIHNLVLYRRQVVVKLKSQADNE